jgi:hypothetical protein
MAWTAWKNFLQKISSPTGKLKTGLGRWTQPNTSRQYKAYITDENRLILRNDQGAWEILTLEKTLRKSRTYLLRTKTATTEPPEYATPTDILHISTTRITVANPSTWKIDTKESLQTDWYKTSTTNTAHIIGSITMIMDDGDIETLISRGSTFAFASDGGHDPISGVSTFGWVATINSTVIAQGRGPAQSHPLLAESFRSEGYGIASVGIFARNLINRFQINSKEHQWFFFLDNKSMIQRLSGYSQLETPKWNLRPDEDITKLAHLILKPIPYQLIHVKSHQDSNKDISDLPFPAVINIMADQQATRQRSLMDKPDKTVQNLLTAQLRINNMCITRDSEKWLLHSAGKIPLQHFYREKFGWSDSTFNAIAWDVQHSALKSFSTADQTRILKFVHGWLPTASRQFKEGITRSPRCPLCLAPREDNMHLFCCNNKEMEAVQEKLQHYIMKDMHDNGDSEISNILEIAILNTCIFPTWAPDLSNVSTKWKAGVREQSRIGWIHILKGRISTTLISSINMHFESLELSGCLYNGNRWAKKLITATWTTMLELWKTRNSIIYNTDKQVVEERMREKPEARIRRCYTYSNIVSAQDRQLWFSTSLEDQLQEEPNRANNWLQGIERIIKITRREQQQRPKESVIMERFLGIKQHPNTQPTHNSQEMGNPRAYVQELNPD